MDNEIMNYEEVMDTEIACDEVENERSGMSNGVAMLIGAGLTAAGIAVVKLGKKAIAKVRARKEAAEIEDEDIVEVDD